MVTIEPIKNQYLTALKERQQIIDKLNEIISGLNALNFDDLTTIQAELVAIRESLQTQNTAITQINNSISQIESELTSFDNRLITLNTNIENTESHLTSFENDTALNLQSKVNKNGDTMTGNLGIPTTTTGDRNKLAVNGERLQNDLDNYSQMVRTSGYQSIGGEKEFINLIKGNVIIFEGGSVPAISTVERTNYHNVLEISPTIRNHYRIIILGGLNNNSITSAEIEIVYATKSIINYVLIYNKSTHAGRPIKIKITMTNENKIRLWILEGQFITYRAYVLSVSDAGQLKYSSAFNVPGTILADPTTQSDYLETVTALNYVDYPIE